MALLETFGFIARLGFTLISILISSVFLWLASKFFKTKKGFGTAFFVSLIVGIAGFALDFFLSILPLINLLGFLNSITTFIVMAILGILMIKSKYELDAGKAFLMWLVWMLMSLIVIGIIAGIFAVLLAGVAVLGGAGALLFR